MRAIEDYTDEELQRILAKTMGAQGGKDRVAAIQAVLDARGVEADSRGSFFASLVPNDAQEG